jgi:hypothetical protein
MHPRSEPEGTPATSQPAGVSGGKVGNDRLSLSHGHSIYKKKLVLFREFLHH